MGFSGLSQESGDVKIVRATPTFDCGGRCALRIHVKGNRSIRVEGDDAPEPDQLRTCLRCRAYRQMVHHPERLMVPQKRVGAKGEGKFERISWDEALDTLAQALLRTRETHGNEAIFLAVGGGYLAALHSGGLAASRLLSQLVW